ncbi:MAG: murein biosynthesis integral membrane protein MurJ [Clostridia bacterium]|nr:murein biosynthesis integral membrane protein MurJ [Clostridia bacterium]
MKKSIIKTFTFMFSAIFLAKILGLVRNIIFASLYGTGYEATAFFTASRIPLQLLDMSLGAAISSTFIPIFNEFLQKDGKERAMRFMNNFMSIIIVISLILTLIGIVFAPQVVNLIAPNLEPNAYGLTVELLQVLFPIMLFTAVAFVFVGFLQSLDEFNIPSIISVVANGIVILYLLLFNDRYGIKGAAIAMLIGWGTQILVQLPVAIKKGYRPKFFIDFKDEGIKKMLVLALPILISTWVQPINNLVNIRFASGLENGQAVSAIEYSYNLYIIIVGVFSYTLSNIIFPELSKLTADNNKEKVKEVLKNSFEVSLLFIIPMSVGIGMLSKDIVKLIYERGEFTAESTLLTSSALMFYAIGMIGYGMMEFLNKAFYAMQDSKTPMKTSIIAILINLVLSICLVKVMGYTGLPLATSITSIVIGFIMMFLVNNKIKGIINKETIKEIIKIVIASLIMAFLILIIKKLIVGETFVLTLLRILISVTGGIVSYFAIVITLKNGVITNFLEKIKTKKQG